MKKKLITICIAISCLFIGGLAGFYIADKSESTENIRKPIKTFYATDAEVDKVYYDLRKAGYSEINIGDRKTFSKNLESYVSASIAWQNLIHAGYRDFGTEKEFILKY